MDIGLTSVLQYWLWITIKWTVWGCYFQPTQGKLVFVCAFQFVLNAILVCLIVALVFFRAVLVFVTLMFYNAMILFSSALLVFISALSMLWECTASTHYCL